MPTYGHSITATQTGAGKLTVKITAGAAATAPSGRATISVLDNSAPMTPPTQVTIASADFPTSSGGTLDVDVTGLANGSYTIYLQDSDGWANMARSVTFTVVTVDVTHPSTSATDTATVEISPAPASLTNLIYVRTDGMRITMSINTHYTYSNGVITILNPQALWNGTFDHFELSFGDTVVVFDPRATSPGSVEGLMHTYRQIWLYGVKRTGTGPIYVRAYNSANPGVYTKSWTFEWSIATDEAKQLLIWKDGANWLGNDVSNNVFDVEIDGQVVYSSAGDAGMAYKLVKGPTAGIMEFRSTIPFSSMPANRSTKVGLAQANDNTATTCDPTKNDVITVPSSSPFKMYVRVNPNVNDNPTNKYIVYLATNSTTGWPESGLGPRPFDYDSITSGAWATHSQSVQYSGPGPDVVVGAVWIGSVKINKNGTLTATIRNADGELSATDYDLKIGSTTGAVATIAPDGSGTRSLSITSLTPGTTYDLQLRATNLPDANPAQSYVVVDSVKVTIPHYTTKVFKEWQKDGVKYDFTTPVTSSFTLKGVWSEVYAVTFKDYDGTVIKTQNVVQDSDIGLVMPADPTRSGYTFAGWECSLDGHIWNNGTDEVFSEMTLTATYTKNS